MKALGIAPSNDALHRALIQAKRLRHAAELSAYVLGEDGRNVLWAATSLPNAWKRLRREAKTIQG